MAKQDLKTELALIGDKSIQVETDDGETIVVPMDKDGNAMANKILFAQIRHVLKKNIKDYHNQDRTLTPKEIRDLAEAAASVAKGSGEVFREADPFINQPGQPATEVKVSEISFDTLKKNDTPASESNPLGNK